MIRRADPEPGAKRETKTTTCYMCACRCGIRVHLRDGKLRYIDGNPNHPINKGVICAKGSAGIMKQESPARLTRPLLRKAGSERGAGEFEPISWERAFAMLTERLATIRATDPKKFALFTGRDQMQALTGLFARQFGTPNYAAHGGFCSVNMAAGMIYTIGGSFWEFGGPDLERAKLFVMIGTAEDHHSNPLKIAIGEFKRARRPLHLDQPGAHRLLGDRRRVDPDPPGHRRRALHGAAARADRAATSIDHAFLKRYTNAPQLVVLDEGEREGLFAFDPDPAKGPPGDGRDPHNKLVWDMPSRQRSRRPTPKASPTAATRRSKATTRSPTAPGSRRRSSCCATASRRARRSGPRRSPASRPTRIRKLAEELGETALQQAFELPIAWTDAWGKRHATTQARPVAFHAMRGLAAHSNGFQTVRALAVLMSVLGTIDAPGGFRHKAPYPRHIVPNYRAFNSPDMIQPNTPLNAAPLGFPANPDELAINADGSPIRIDHAFSWEHPLSAHGLMHNVITNATRGDPYRLDTLLIFMANMAWNSTHEHDGGARDAQPQGRGRRVQDPVPRRLRRVPERDGRVRRPRAARHDVPRAPRRDEHARPADLRVRRPGRFGARAGRAADRRVQAVPGGAGRARVAAQVSGVHHRRRRAQVQGLPRLRRQLRAAAGHRLPDGLARQGRRRSTCAASRTRSSGRCTRRTTASSSTTCRETMHYMRNWNREYLDFAKDKGWRQKNDLGPARALLATRCRASASPRRARRAGRQPPEHLRERIDDLLRSAAVLVPAARGRRDRPRTPIRSNAITQRPMAMYHSWDSQNAWLRQIHSHNYLQVNPLTARRPASPTAAGAGSRAAGAGCAAWSATARRSSRARCGPGTRSARPTAPGSSRPAPTRRARASCSTT